jgi:hypothetical protein
VKADIGAYVEPALRIDANGVSFMVGEPLLSRSDAWRSRSLDLGDLHAGFARDEFEPLTRARGVFCAANYQPQSGALTLVTDKLGLRPMYYSVGERYVIFATALRVLAAVPEVPKVMDLRGVTETYALDYALGDRTPFASVKLLKSAEMLRIAGADIRRRQYWNWDELKTSDKPVRDLVSTVFDKFRDAVALRSRADTATASYLSGGLDSRAIVMALVQLGLRVYTFNFSIAGSQDQVFGAEFARLAGTNHTEHPREQARNVSEMMPETWRAVSNASQTAERPGIVWSGNGGSVALGHVHLTRRMVTLARAGDIDGALGLYSDESASLIPLRLVRAEMRDSLSRVAHDGLLQEIADLRCGDPGRNLYLFLMLNDQRRSCAEHFEEIDVNRLEYHLPFFDSDFVASVLSVPIDACLDHAFYMRWMELFPKIVLSVPWQAYPGHEPCPLPIASELGYQWEAAEVARVRRAQRRDRLRQAAQMLRAPDFPDPLLKRRSLQLAAWIYRLRLRNVGHVIGAAHVYYRYWSQCAGKYSPLGVTSALGARGQ